MDPGQGHNRYMRGPPLKDIFRVGRLQQQTECIAMIQKHLERSVVFDMVLCRVLDLFISTYFLSNILMGQGV